MEYVRGPQRRAGRLSVVAVLAALVSLLATLVARADETANGGLTVPALHDYLRGAVRGIMLHETAHALIDILDLPLVGPEEDVADEFAAMVTIASAARSEFGHRNALALVDTSLTFWNLFKQGAPVSLGGSPGSDLRSLERYDPHSPDIRRALNTLCLLYGAFPERYSMIPERAGMAPGDAANCQRDYLRKAHAWERILAPHRPSAAPGSSFSYSYTPSAAPRGRFYENQFLGFLDLESSVARLLNFEIALPSPLPIQRLDCGFENAFFDPESKRILLCNEFVHTLAEAYVSHLTGLSYDAWWSKALVARAPANFVGAWNMTSIAGPEGTAPNVPQELSLRADGTFTWTIRWTLDPGLPRPDTERRGLWGVEGEELWLLETAWVPSLPDDCLHSGCEPPDSMNGLEAHRVPIKWLGADRLDYNNGIIFDRSAGG